MTEIRLSLTKKESEKADRLKHKYRVGSKSKAIKEAVKEVPEDYWVGARRFDELSQKGVVNLTPQEQKEIIELSKKLNGG